jgi:hypothetical protein
MMDYALLLSAVLRTAAPWPVSLAPRLWSPKATRLRILARVLERL